MYNYTLGDTQCSAGECYTTNKKYTDLNKKNTFEFQCIHFTLQILLYSNVNQQQTSVYPSEWTLEFQFTLFVYG